MRCPKPARCSTLVVGAMWLVTSAFACGDASEGGGEADETDDSDDSNETDTGSLEGYSPCAADERLGGFDIVLTETYTGVQGSVLDGVLPTDVPEVSAEEGDCRLLEDRSFFCDPSCDSDETCAEGNTCIPYPRRQDVGTVEIDGLEAEVVMTPTDPGNTYTNPEPLPHPGFVEGAEIALDASGGDLEPFLLRGVGVGALSSEMVEVPVAEEQATALSWDPPASSGPARVHILLNISHHGGTPGWVECDVDDDGEFAIPAALVTELLNLGASGFPTLQLTRRSVDSAALELGCVELEVSSSLELPVIIDGLISCVGDEDCPDGQTCQADLTCG